MTHDAIGDVMCVEFGSDGVGGVVLGGDGSERVVFADCAYAADDFGPRYCLDISLRVFT